MSKLKERIGEEVEKMSFSCFEMAGLKSDPILAIKLGVALGYKMAINDMSEMLEPEVPKCCDNPKLSFGLSSSQWICENCGATNRSEGG